MTIPDIFPADLFYSTFPADGSEPFLNMEINPITGFPDSNVTLVPIQCEMTNIRGKEAEFGLDDAGFKYIKHKSSFTDFKNDEEIRRVYYKESMEVIKEHTGARRVVIYDHTIRRHRPADEPETSIQRRPALRVHVDQTPKAAVNRVRRHVPELAEELLKHRFQILNLWRPIGVPALDTPLAICDFRSINWDKDLVPTRLVYTDSVGETCSVAYNPTHKWRYVRGMTPEEAVLIKNADSKKGVARSAPHSAFTDPTTPKDAPPRESIELRALVLYET
ncbi:hypothetical protein Clacol_009744 [Clathrus columnatus]|uniref:Methyltransferase n=1 Tax=Clathrus columnatus TaxID=1419009 RepID=A0AAV5ALD6_9AGAM|nr:hypothetical protein Clacol_009744 [Clathrus columnatus]